MKEVGSLTSLMPAPAGDCLVLEERSLFSEGLQPRVGRDWSYCVKEDGF